MKNKLIPSLRIFVLILLVVASFPLVAASHESNCSGFLRIISLGFCPSIESLYDGVKKIPIEGSSGIDRLNKNPELYEIADVSVVENEVVRFPIYARDSDLDNLSFEVINSPTWGGILEAVSKPGKIKAGFQGMPGVGDAGIYSVTFVVRDQLGAHDHQIMNIIVRPRTEINNIPNNVGTKGLENNTGNEVRNNAAEKHKELKVTTARIGDEIVAPGEDTSLYINLHNGGKDLKDVSVSVMWLDYGVRVRSSEFDLKSGKSKNIKLQLEIPYYVLPGEYFLKINVGNTDFHDTAYRLLRVI
jgi:hypothetical protein